MKQNFIPKLGRFLYKLAKSSAGARLEDGLGTQTVQRIQQWIYDRRWAENASAQQVADSLGVTRQELAQYFRNHSGRSFLQWRKETRIEEAKLLLSSDDDTPTAVIGEAVGLSDKSNFRRQFKQLTGLTPAQWRLKHKGHIGIH